jgi:hypothetical protein
MFNLLDSAAAASAVNACIGLVLADGIPVRAFNILGGTIATKSDRLPLLKHTCLYIHIFTYNNIIAI